MSYQDALAEALDDTYWLPNRPQLTESARTRIADAIIETFCPSKTEWFRDADAVTAFKKQSTILEKHFFGSAGRESYERRANAEKVHQMSEGRPSADYCALLLKLRDGLLG